MPQKKSFVMYSNYYGLLELLTLRQRGALITAIFEYNINGSMPTELDDITRMAFVIIKDTLDRDAEKYEDICKRRSEFGKKGGRPKKQNTQ